jgi:1,4-dihydroxy-6-naphthoate synthase
MDGQPLTLGFSPCPNDTFMFAALVNGWIDMEGLSFDVRLEDVETLNALAGSAALDITKLSFHRALALEETYALLNAGAALGRGCGPLVIARTPMSRDELIRGPVALPGEWTTAHLLFNRYYPETERKEFHVFHAIEDLVLQGKVAAGVIIHENRFTYAAKGLVKLADLGEAWEAETGLPIPLGGIFAARRLGDDQIGRIDRVLHRSIDFAFRHPDRVMPYVRCHAQEMDEQVMKNHIDLYVNAFSLDLGTEGRTAIGRLKAAR